MRVAPTPRHIRAGNTLAEWCGVAGSLATRADSMSSRYSSISLSVCSNDQPRPSLTQIRSNNGSLSPANLPVERAPAGRVRRTHDDVPRIEIVVTRAHLQRRARERLVFLREPGGAVLAELRRHTQIAADRLDKIVAASQRRNTQVQPCEILRQRRGRWDAYRPAADPRRGASACGLPEARRQRAAPSAAQSAPTARRFSNTRSMTIGERRATTAARSRRPDTSARSCRWYSRRPAARRCSRHRRAIAAASV